jgi:hypothetical protein
VTQRGAEGVSQPRVSPAPHGWGGTGISTSVDDVEAARRGPRSEEVIVKTRAAVPVCSAREPMAMDDKLNTQPTSTAGK